MNATGWTAIPGKLAEAGFAVTYERVSYDPEHPLWNVKATREGCECSTLGETLGAAFVALERRTQEIGSGGAEFPMPETRGKNLTANIA